MKHHVFSNPYEEDDQVVQLMPASFEGVISEFERELGVGAWMISALTGDVFWSEGTYYIHDVPPGTPIALESALSYFDPDEAERIREIVEQALRRKEGYVFDAVVVSELGVHKPIRSHARYVEQSGIPFLMGIIKLTDQSSSSSHDRDDLEA